MESAISEITSKLRTLRLVPVDVPRADRKSTRLNSSHSQISYAVFCLKKKKLAHEVPSHYSIATGISVAFGDAVRVAERALQFATFPRHPWNRPVVIRIEHRFVRPAVQ